MLDECHWNALSHILTPTALKQCLKKLQIPMPCSTPNNNNIFLTMFENMHFRFFYFLEKGHPAQNLWEGYLSQEGFIPKLMPSSAVTVDRYGYAMDNEWKEWNIASVTVMRMYWTSMFQGITDVIILAKLEGICQSILSTLPGDQVKCEECKWMCSQSSMYNNTVCCYCRQGPINQLRFFRGVSYLVPTK